VCLQGEEGEKGKALKRVVCREIRVRCREATPKGRSRKMREGSAKP
jgi:hypothetical protein